MCFLLLALWGAGRADCVGAQGLSQEASKSGHPVWVLRRKSAEMVAWVALQNLFAKSEEAAGNPPKLRREIRLWMFPSEVEPPSLIPRLSRAVLYGPLGILTTHGTPGEEGVPPAQEGHAWKL